ncbi:MAG: hypothetical protein K2N18_01855, partial [Clostridia bacterium]|nr:hypothetical protein [Clostridia bacterium]
KQSNFEIAHGVAVAEGIGIMASAAQRSGELSKGDCDRISELLSKYGLNNIPKIDGNIMDAIKVDKKAEGANEISIVVINGIVNCTVNKMTFSEFESYIGIE